MNVKKNLLVLLLLTVAAPVVSQDLTLHHVQQLDFGDQIFPGIEKSITPKDPGAAKVEITGEAGRQIQIQFQLTDHLQDEYGNNLSINFSSTGAAYHTSSTGKSSATVFDPNVGMGTPLNTEGKLYIWFGGNLMPHQSQPGNSYSADLIMDVSYAN